MNNLIIFGSPRVKGNTKKMIEIFTKDLKGKHKIISAYKMKVSPCIDCKYCWTHNGCSIQDNMQNIYEEINNADNIIFASPLYFNSLPGPLKNIIDRCQVYWASIKRNDKIKNSSKKRAVVLLCGGAPAYGAQFKAAELVLNGVLKDIGAELLKEVFIPNTDQIPIDENKEAIIEIKNAAHLLNKNIQ